MDVLKTITEIVNKLNEIDNYDSSLSQLLSECNEREQDLLHYIENNKINMLWCYKYVRELKNVIYRAMSLTNKDVLEVYDFNFLRNAVQNELDSNMSVNILTESGEIKTINQLYNTICKRRKCDVTV